MTNECEKLGDNLVKNSHVEGGDILMTNDIDIDKNTLKINHLRNEIEELKTLFVELRSLMIENRKNLKQTRFDLWERTSDNRQIAQAAKEALEREFGRKLID